MFISTPDEPQLSAYSDNWNDISMFYDEIKKDYSVSTIISSPSVLKGIEHPETKCYIVLGVEKEFTFDEAEAV
ncbi:MAG: hypothetical protein KAJ51_00160, partial [Thermoplasmata archaeon]|nr:hypothetical protein [Thermoplasmata archaeon]